MLLLFLLFLLPGVRCKVQFLALEPNSSLSIPGAQILVKNIDQSSPNYLHWESALLHNTASVESSNSRQQFHSVVKDGTGMYYSTRSVVAEVCSLREVSRESYFYEPIPSVFEVGLAALLPCLITGIPTPTKHVERCKTDTCEDVIEMDIEDSTVTAEGHLLIRNVTEAHSGWYRCVANNSCGALSSSPIFLSIRKANAESRMKTDYVLSRRTDSFDLLYKEDEHLGSYKELRRNLTEYEMWRLNTTSPSYQDEVLYLNSTKIYFYYHPNFDIVFNFSPLVVDQNHYGSVRLNDSFSTHFSYENVPLDMIEFKTDYKYPPQIQPVVNQLSNNALDEAVIEFSVEEYSVVSSTFQCYRNAVRLLNNWKTKLERTEESIKITLKYPLISDRGHYQCSISYDVVYLSKSIYTHFEEPVKTYQVSSTTSSTSATLTWDILTLSGHYHTYQGQFVVLLSDTYPRITTQNSMTFHNLTPYKEYTWRIITPDQSPVTDPEVFRTEAEVPSANVGNISVIRATTKLSLSWQPFPRLQWYDSFVYFLININSNQSGEVKSWSLKKYNSEPIRLENLHQATQYNISVAACNSRGCSSNTSNVSVMTKHVELTQRPAVRLTHASSSHVELRTSNITDGVDTYLELYRGDKCSPSPPLLSIQLKTPFSRVENLKTFTTYALRIHSTNGYSTTPWSPCISFTTKFNWIHVIVPAFCLVLVLILLAILRALIKSRCPDVVNKIKQALEPKYLNIIPDQEDWDPSIEVDIIHTKVESYDV